MITEKGQITPLGKDFYKQAYNIGGHAKLPSIALRPSSFNHKLGTQVGLSVVEESKAMDIRNFMDDPNDLIDIHRLDMDVHIKLLIIESKNLLN